MHIPITPVVPATYNGATKLLNCAICRRNFHVVEHWYTTHKPMFYCHDCSIEVSRAYVTRAYIKARLQLRIQETSSLLHNVSTMVVATYRINATLSRSGMYFLRLKNMLETRLCNLYTRLDISQTETGIACLYRCQDCGLTGNTGYSDFYHVFLCEECNAFRGC